MPIGILAVDLSVIFIEICVRARVYEPTTVANDKCNIRVTQQML